MSGPKHVDQDLAEHCQKLDNALHHMLDENDALRAELAQVRARLDALMTAFDDNGTLGNTAHGAR